MTTKMVFHGSDIEKICDYYHLNKEDIVKFGANVNPLGLSASVKKEIAENVDLFFFLSGQRLCISQKYDLRILQDSR